MELIIAIRRTVDYKNMNEDKFCDQFITSLGGREGLSKIYRCIKIWNRLFRISYFEFRHHIRNIASTNWISMPNLHAILVGPSINAFTMPQQVLIVPMDDDDWLNPDLMQQNWTGDVLHWNQGRTGGNVNFCTQRNIFLSNNVALSKSGYDRLTGPDKEKLTQSSWFHGLLHEIAIGQQMEIKQSNMVFSISNKTPASLSRMWQAIHALQTNKRIADMLVEQIDVGKRDKVIPPECEWARTYIVEMQKLYQACE